MFYDLNASSESEKDYSDIKIVQKQCNLLNFDLVYLIVGYTKCVRSYYAATPKLVKKNIKSPSRLLERINQLDSEITRINIDIPDPAASNSLVKY